MSNSVTDTLRLAPDVAYVRHAGEVFVLALDQAHRHQEPLALTGSAGYLWHLLREHQPIAVDELARHVGADFPDLDPARARADVEDFARTLLARGILTFDPPPGPVSPGGPGSSRR